MDLGIRGSRVAPAVFDMSSSENSGDQDWCSGNYSKEGGIYLQIFKWPNTNDGLRARLERALFLLEMHATVRLLGLVLLVGSILWQCLSGLLSLLPELP